MELRQRSLESMEVNPQFNVKDNEVIVNYFLSKFEEIKVVTIKDFMRFRIFNLKK